MRAVLAVFLLVTCAVGLSARRAEPPARSPRVPSLLAEAPESWEIALNGADGMALAGATVRVRVDGEEWREAVTDAQGHLQVPVAGRDGHVEIAAGDDAWDVDGSGATLHCAAFAPLTAVAVDGETGAPIAGLASQAASHVAAGPDRVVRFEVQAPDGYVEALKGPRELKTYVSRYAREVRVVAPLRHEARIRVRVLNADGDPVPGAEITGIYMAGPEPSILPGGGPPEVELSDEVVEMESERGSFIECTAAPASDDGWIRVRGIPHLLDEHYWICAGDDEHEAYIGLTLGSFGENYEREIRLPAEPTMVWPDYGSSFGMSFG